MKPQELSEYKNRDLLFKINQIVQRLSRSQQIKLLGLLEYWSLEEPRKFPRKRCLTPVDFSINGGFFREFMENLSPGGAFIKTQHPASEDTRLTMVFTLANYSEPFKVTGKIAWADVSGSGVQFDQANPYIGAILSLK